MSQGAQSEATIPRIGIYGIFSWSVALRTREHQFVDLDDAIAHARIHVARQLAGQPVPRRRL